MRIIIEMMGCNWKRISLQFPYRCCILITISDSEVLGKTNQPFAKQKKKRSVNWILYGLFSNQCNLLTYEKKKKHCGKSECLKKRKIIFNWIEHQYARVHIPLCAPTGSVYNSSDWFVQTILLKHSCFIVSLSFVFLVWPFNVQCSTQIESGPHGSLSFRQNNEAKKEMAWVRWRWYLSYITHMDTSSSFTLFTRPDKRQKNPIGKYV